MRNYRGILHYVQNDNGEGILHFVQNDNGEFGMMARENKDR